MYKTFYLFEMYNSTHFLKIKASSSIVHRASCGKEDEEATTSCNAHRQRRRRIVAACEGRSLQVGLRGTAAFCPPALPTSGTCPGLRRSSGLRRRRSLVQRERLRRRRKQVGVMPSSKKQSGKKVDWKQASRKGCSVRLLLGYAAPLLLTPAAVVNSDMMWCLSLCLLIVTWTLLGTVPVPLAWLLPFFVLPLAGVTSISDLSHMFMEDSLVILLLGMNVLVAVGEETALCSRVALYVIEAFGLRLRGILLGITGVTFLSAQLLMGGSATLLMCAVVEATMFELQHDIIAATIAHGKRRSVRTTVGGDVVMTPVHVMIISPRKTPSSGTSLDDDEDDFDEMDESSEDDEDDMRPRVLVPSMAPFDARNPGAYYELHGSVPDDPRYIVSMDAVIPEIEENEDPNAPKKSPILRHRNTAKVFLLEAHRFHKIKKALLINVAHTSAVGCMATLLGSTSGLYLRDYFHFTYGYDAVTALSWTLLGLPVAAVSVLLCAFITYYLFLRSYDIQEDRDTLNVITEIIKKKRKFLGKLTCKERILMAALALLFVCCITISGISSLFGIQEQLSIKYAHESVNVMVVVVLLSFLPHGGRKGSVLDWKNVSGRISWRALLSVGGGLSLAGAVEWTGLSRRITDELSSLDFLTPLQTQVVLILLTTVLTEVNTNVVIARLLIPIASDIGVLTNVHPLYYALPVAMASCTPTVLPTAAPSIAVVTSCMDIQIVDILYPGLAVKLSSILLVLATVNTVGVSLFSLGDLPAWAVAKNGIMTAALANASSAA